MRIIANICSNNLEKSRDFYTELLGLTVKYESDWYIQLCLPGNPDIEYGIIQRDHEIIPSEYQKSPVGMVVTFVVDDVDKIYEKALTMTIPIIQPPQDEFYGQRRFLTNDPSGCLIDICSPVTKSERQ